jgi:alpha-beta hydrolase superfamily lysophospholipase
VGVYWIFDPEVNELNETTRGKLSGTYVSLSDGVTHYKLEGPEKGRVVVLVHGGTVPIWTWDKQIPNLIKAGFKVLSYDQESIPFLVEIHEVA